MDIGVVGDVHLSKYSSILRKNNAKYTQRLYNIIDSINWAEELTKHNDKVVYLGDFFDQCDLKAEELTCLTEIKWNDKPHYFLVGNHEIAKSDLSISSAHILKLIRKNFTIVDKPLIEDNILYLPYILEENRKPLIEYIGNTNIKVIFSHNDVKGVQMGSIVSTQGFDISDIKENCDLFVNGHIHNTGIIEDTIINVGNLTGQNFSENAEVYPHHILTFNTDYLHPLFSENPYAFNFYKFDYVGAPDELPNFKKNSVVTIKTTLNDLENIKPYVENNKNVVASRFLIYTPYTENVEYSTKDLSMNHLEEFSNYVLNTFTKDTELVKSELQEVL